METENLNNQMQEEDGPEIRSQLYLKAFMEGREKERNLAVEAHRLRCSYLFGNRCMNHSRSKLHTQGICIGNCFYIRQYEFELYKLEN